MTVIVVANRILCASVYPPSAVAANRHHPYALVVTGDLKSMNYTLSDVSSGLDDNQLFSNLLTTTINPDAVKYVIALAIIAFVLLVLVSVIKYYTRKFDLQQAALEAENEIEMVAAMEASMQQNNEGGYIEGDEGHHQHHHRHSHHQG
jgi:hypothetical protein